MVEGAIFQLAVTSLLNLSRLFHLERSANLVTCNAVEMHAALSSSPREGLSGMSK